MKSSYLDRPIAFQRIFVSLGVGITGALMLSQAVYWSKRTSDPDGWFYKSQDEWEQETGLSRREQETARKRLISKGFIKEQKKGVPCRLFYRVDYFAIDNAISEQTRLAECDILECTNAPDSDGGIRHAITENTTETTNNKRPARRALPLTTIDEYLANCKRDGIKPIRDDDPIISESESIGIPYDWLVLNWLVLIERNRETGKKQKDWPAVFRRTVRERWYKLWWFDNNNVCILSSDGKQAQLRHGAK